MTQQYIVNPNHKAVVVTVEQETTSLINDLTSMFPGDEIADEAQLTTASDALTRISKQMKLWDAKRTEIVKPANDYVRSVNDLFRKFTEPVKREEGRIRGMMSAFRARVQQQRREEYEANMKKAETAFPNGSPIPEVVAPIPDDTIRKVETEHGDVGFTTVWKYQIIDPDKVPKEYWMIDEVKIGKVVKAGIRDIPGVRIFAEEVPTVRGK